MLEGLKNLSLEKKKTMSEGAYERYKLSAYLLEELLKKEHGQKITHYKNP